MQQKAKNKQDGMLAAKPVGRGAVLASLRLKPPGVATIRSEGVVHLRVGWLFLVR